MLGFALAGSAAATNAIDRHYRPYLVEPTAAQTTSSAAAAATAAATVLMALHAEVREDLNRSLRGWSNYFCLGSTSGDIKAMLVS
jgi:hypothetical protein